MPGKPQHSWRPAPFPVYAPDGRRLWLERLLALCCAVILLAAVSPRATSQEQVLSLPVSYARVELERRSPALVALNLPSGDYNVAPASLGYFAAPNLFVYSATVSRGVIYGQAEGSVVVLEVAAPPGAEVYLEDQVSQIRAFVREENRRENLLHSARQNQVPEYERLKERAGQLLEKLSTDLTGPLPSRWLDTVAHEYRGELVEVTAALSDYGRHRAGLKRLYYDGQLARLDLLERQFDLQLALARLPDPQIEELLSVGDEQLVRGTVLGEVERLEAAWGGRLTELERQLASDRQWLARVEVRYAAPAPDPLSLELLPEPYLDGPPPGPGTPLDPRSQLEQAIVQARLAVASAEASSLEQCLERLSSLRLHVAAGGVPQWTDLPRLEFRPQRLSRPLLASLPDFASVVGAAQDQPAALGLLRALAYSFEQRTVPGELERAGEIVDNNGRPFELAYGLVLVDQAVRREENGEAGAGGIAQAVGRILEQPDEYGMAALDLGYLRFMRWYAQLSRAEAVPAGGTLASENQSVAGAASQKPTSGSSPAG